MAKMKDSSLFTMAQELEEKLPAKMKQTIAERSLAFYTIDATKVAREIGLGQRINTVMQVAPVIHSSSGVIHSYSLLVHFAFTSDPLRLHLIPVTHACI